MDEFNADWVSPPSDTLLETMNYYNMSQFDLAYQMDIPMKTVKDILSGTGRITPEIADKLGKVFCVPASFWNNRQKRYDEWSKQE